jgi:hypothetical protein
VAAGGGDDDAIAAFHVSGLPAGEIKAAGATFVSG